MKKAAWPLSDGAVERVLKRLAHERRAVMRVPHEGSGSDAAQRRLGGQKPLLRAVAVNLSGELKDLGELRRFRWLKVRRGQTQRLPTRGQLTGALLRHGR